MYIRRVCINEFICTPFHSLQSVISCLTQKLRISSNVNKVLLISKNYSVVKYSLLKRHKQCIVFILQLDSYQTSQKILQRNKCTEEKVFRLK